MLLGIPRGFFYYDYNPFITTIFENTGCRLVMGKDNDHETLERGMEHTVDEACMPVKLFAGQIEKLVEECDYILLARVMKDCKGKWLCPKLLGLPELCVGSSGKEKLISTEPLYFNDKRLLKKAMWKVCRQMKVNKRVFDFNFDRAYREQLRIAQGKSRAYVEAAWEFVPDIPKEGEIILPNTRTVFLAGHCYNVFDKFSNGNIMKKLDELGIGIVTEKDILQREKEKALNSAGLMKEPYWESVERILGGILCAKDRVDGIIYLSSFSCGQDSIILELVKYYAGDMPMLVLKLDEHQASAGVETRLEAFDDLLRREGDDDRYIS
ncbi:MAG: hypothetical protein GX663_00140 [Clostridiales bacterium]|nr:hypothetical protein [Clostridiales bacterium]